MKTSKLILGLFITSSLIVGCSDDDDATIPEPVLEQEVITTMNVTLTAPDGNTVSLRKYDADGDGPNEPVITVSSPLTANTIYSGEIELLNEIANENVTEEVKESADEHQFFYVNSEALDVSFAYADTENDYDADTTNDDEDANPVGIVFTLSTIETSTGNITITLKHEPEKDASGVREGNIANSGGEEDFIATFPVTIQ